jgi:RNA polymerase sigma-70 factor (ECF subfamily)
VAIPFIPGAAPARIRLRVSARTGRSGRDERRLAKRLKRRDRDALRDVYEQYGRTTYGLLLQILRDRATAEDVQQQVFLQVWERVEGFDPERGTLLTWIMTIARSRAIDELRRRVPEPRDPVGTLALLESSESGDDVDALVEQWHLAHLLGRLPAGEADLLRRRFYDGRTQSEIAAETGIPLGTVKARMLSGLDALRAMLGERP